MGDGDGLFYPVQKFVNDRVKIGYLVSGQLNCQMLKEFSEVHQPELAVDNDIARMLFAYRENCWKKQLRICVRAAIDKATEARKEYSDVVHVGQGNC